jgi:hypothetical protein
LVVAHRWGVARLARLAASGKLKKSTDDDDDDDDEDPGHPPPIPHGSHA